MLSVACLSRYSLYVSLAIVLLAPLQFAHAQSAASEASATPAASATPIEAAPDAATDAAIQQRIAKIYAQIDALAQLQVAVNEGVATVAGEVANEKQAQRALDLANRLQGIVTVEDDIERTLDVEENITPLVDQVKRDTRRFLNALPLILIALLAFAAIAFVGLSLAKWSALWRRLSPNVFLAELLAQAVRVAAIVLGLIVALNLVGAAALVGTVLGGAGVLGLAIGFAVRDSMENYISSIMLSIRQPFRANDHVVIDVHEGIVMRLTSRATILMTLDGNHLRIPNSTVFKAVILNYTRNPERRFAFKLGVDADDDPLAAMQAGVTAIGALDFILAKPEPAGVVESVGDSNIVLSFAAWVDQQHTDLLKARSLAISAAKNVLEEQGFTLPEPIYRLRFDKSITQVNLGETTPTVGETQPKAMQAEPKPAPRPAAKVTKSDATVDVRPDKRLQEKVNAERAQDDGESNLLDRSRPVE